VGKASEPAREMFSDINVLVSNHDAESISEDFQSEIK
jgi:hypothetical protein